MRWPSTWVATRMNPLPAEALGVPMEEMRALHPFVLVPGVQ
jgi:hypothetical protein